MIYEFTPRLLSTVSTSIAAVDVRDESGTSVGRILPGSIPGCEPAGTFQFESPGIAPTALGIGSLRRSWIKRLLRPDYVVLRNGVEQRLSDNFGENLLYFAVSGQVDAQAYSARQGWDDSVEVKIDGELCARWSSDELSGVVAVDVNPRGAASNHESTAFAVTLLLPFMHMIHSDESEIIESVLD